MDVFNREHLKPEFVKINPQHSLPTIDDNGFLLWEAGAISTYLADTKSPGSSLYPTDPKQRAVVSQRLFFDSTYFYIPMVSIVVSTSNLFMPIKYVNIKISQFPQLPIVLKGETTVVEEKRKLLNDAFKYLDTYLTGQQWVAGANVTIADLHLLASVSSFAQMGANLSAYPNVTAWLDRCKTLPGYAENEEGAKILGDFVKSKLTDKTIN